MDIKNLFYIAAKINEKAAIDLILSWLEPLINIVLVVLPSLFVLYALRQAISYYKQPKDRRQEGSYYNEISDGLIILIIAESIVAIVKIIVFK